MNRAEAETRRALRADAGAVEAHTLLGIVLASKGNANAEAADALLQAIALNPNSFDAQFYLGRVQYALKDFAGAVKSLQVATRLDPRHTEAKFFLGTALESAGDTNAAMAEYQSLAKENPDSAWQLGYGALLVKQGKVAEAVDVLKRAGATAKNLRPTGRLVAPLHFRKNMKKQSLLLKRRWRWLLTDLMRITSLVWP